MGEEVKDLLRGERPVEGGREKDGSWLGVGRAVIKGSVARCCIVSQSVFVADMFDLLLGEAGESIRAKFRSARARSRSGGVARSTSVSLAMAPITLTLLRWKMLTPTCLLLGAVNGYQLLVYA